VSTEPPEPWWGQRQDYEDQLDAAGDVTRFLGDIRPGIAALIARKEPVTLAEYRDLQLNSFERNALYWRLDPEALHWIAAHTLRHCDTPRTSTYEATLIGVLVPLLLKALRLAAGMGSIPGVMAAFQDALLTAVRVQAKVIRQAVDVLADAEEDEAARASAAEILCRGINAPIVAEIRMALHSTPALDEIRHLLDRLDGGNPNAQRIQGPP